MKHMAYISLQALAGGTAPHVHVKEIVGNLEQTGWRVTLYSPEYHGAGNPGLPARFFRQWLLQARAGLKPGDAEVFYVRSHPNALPIVLMARMQRRKVVLEVNGPPADIFIHHTALRFLAPLLRLLLWIQFRLATGIVCVTEQLRQQVARQAGDGKVILVPNAANERVFRPGASPESRIDGSYVVFSGTLRRWHGVAWLIDAARHADWPQGTRLVIAGEGPDDSGVRRAVESGLPNLVWVKRLSYEKVAGVLAGARASLVTTIDVEGRAVTGLAPLKLYESMACGVPVIVSDLPFQSDIVRGNGTGLVVEPGDVQGLVDAVNRILDDPEAAAEMGRRGRVYIESGNTWRDRAARIDEFLVSLMPG